MTTDKEYEDWLEDFEKWEKPYKEERWGCPDWRVRKAYPANIDSLEDWQWRWEFLRRLHEYRMCWHIHRDDPGPFYPFPVGLLLEMHDLIDLVDPRTTPNDNPFTSLTMPGLYYLPEDQVFEYYNSLPLEDRFNEFFEDLKRGALLTNEPETKVLQYAVFDLSRPLKDQLLRTEKMLKERIKARAKKLPIHIPKPHLRRSARKNWIRHLRVLDAIHQGATNREIWDVLKTEEIKFKLEHANIDSAAFEALLDKEVYATGKSNLVGPTVDGWFKNANTTARNVARLLLRA